METDLGAQLDAISGLIWGPWVLIPLLVGTGVLLTVRLRGLQFRELGRSLYFAFVQRREPGAEARGCSIAADEMLQAPAPSQPRESGNGRRP